MRSKLILISIFSLVAAALMSGCSTPRTVASLEGHGRKQVYPTAYDAVWRAAIDAAQQGSLEVMNADKGSGYISARRGMRLETFGENVGVWIKKLSPEQTEVEVVSRQAGPPALWLKNWENEILRAISANLTRDTAYNSVMEPAGAEARREVIVTPAPGTKIEINRNDSLSSDDQFRLQDRLRREKLRREEDIRLEELRRDEDILREKMRLEDERRREEPRRRENRERDNL